MLSRRPLIFHEISFLSGPKHPARSIPSASTNATRFKGFPPKSDQNSIRNGNGEALKPSYILRQNRNTSVITELDLASIPQPVTVLLKLSPHRMKQVSPRPPAARFGVYPYIVSRVA